MSRLTIFVLVLPVLALISCANVRKPDPGENLLIPIPAYGAAPLVRVKLAQPSGTHELKVETGPAWMMLDSKRVEVEGEIEIKSGGGGIHVEGHGIASAIEITPRDQPAHFTLNERVYRGRLRVAAAGSGWDVINVVDLEQYVAGVIGWEMIASWPVEALRAQAVASRTYAVFHLERGRAEGKAWDVDDTTQYQVYGGLGPAKARFPRESDNVLAAREQTSGMILTYNGKGFRAFFHSTSGGHTVSPQVGFGIPDYIPPLRGVDLGEFSKESPRFKWEQTMTASEVRARLIERGISQSEIIRIDRLESAPGGHALTLRLYDRRGRHEVVHAIDVRQALGLASTNFDAARLGDEWTFTGRGFGHGCGMCQWSARGMATAGWRAEKILQTMYPGSELKRVY